METIIKRIDRRNAEKEDFKEESQILRAGGLIAFPTETVYGLGADAFNPDAAKKIYKAKGRPSDNPLIVHIGAISQLEQLAEKIPEKGKKLAEVFWPGPLTLIFEKTKRVPYQTTGGLDTVAVRMPNHPVALELIKKSGILLAAPSANTSGKPSPTKAKHVWDDLHGKVNLILDGGDAQLGLESTIVDLTGEIPMVLRPGFVTKHMLEEVIGPVLTEEAAKGRKENGEAQPKAPGMKYKHYAPKGELTIYEGELKTVVTVINQLAKNYESAGKRVGILASEETMSFYHTGIIKNIGSREDENMIARLLYQKLREFDEAGAEVILAEDFASEGLGYAIMNRLIKAAGYRIISLKEGDRKV